MQMFSVNEWYTFFELFMQTSLGNEPADMISRVLPSTCTQEIFQGVCVPMNQLHLHCLLNVYANCIQHTLKAGWQKLGEVSNSIPDGLAVYHQH